MRIEQSIEVDAPRPVVWDYVTDPANNLEFMHGATRWEVAGGIDRGLGARYRVLLHIGSADVGGLIEVVEWSPPGDMAWSSVTGIDQRGRWRLRDLPQGGTRVTFRFAYGVAGGGLWGLISERVAARWLRSDFRRTLENLKRALEGDRTLA
ncbi:MAG: SRPBCC family protein [Actinobacteria bacterium]|nr:SRPBCC family protein [Actinomycetota bacterium]